MSGEKEDKWTDSVEDMAAADQIKELEGITKHWSDHKIIAPRVNVFELDSADRWEDWKFKMRSHFMCYKLTALIDKKFVDEAKRTDNFKLLDGFAVMNLGMNLSPALRSLGVSGLAG